LGAESLHPLPADRLGHRPGLEGPEIAVDPGIDLGQLGVECCQLALVAVMSECCPLLGFCHRSGEQVDPVVGGKEGVENPVVQGLCRQPVGSTGFRAVALAPATGVVAVGGIAPGGRGPGEAAPTGATNDKAGQQVLGAVGGPLGDVLAPFKKDGLGGIE
jgi:hypothetical protein